MLDGGRVTKSSNAVRLPRSKFEKGDLTGNEQPMAVWKWESEESFQEHKLGNFHTSYNAMRFEFGGRHSTYAKPIFQYVFKKY